MNYISEDLWSKPDMSNYTQHNILAKAVAKHLREKLRDLSPPQEAILDHQLQRALNSRQGQASSVTKEQIIGCYEMIFEVWGAPFEAHYQELQRQKSK